MRNKFLSIAFLGTIITLNAQTTQTRPLTAFSKIQVADAVNVFYSTSDTLEVKVSGDEKEIANVETKIEGSTLIISAKGKSKNPVNVYIKNKHLNDVVCSGASSFKSLNTIKTDSISFTASGASHISATVQSKKINDAQRGASEISLSGTTNELKAELSEASSLKAYDLTSKKANVLTSGASRANVNANEKLVANASGASNIRIKDEVKDITADATLAASISSMDEKISYGKDLNTHMNKGKK